MTRLLLEHGADPNLPEEGAPRGLSLWIAVNDRQREMSAMLLAHGADPNAPVESSGTPMSQAPRTGAHGAAPRARRSPANVGPRSSRAARARRTAGGSGATAPRQPRVDPRRRSGWGDGILAGPARDGRHDVIAMLMRLGARAAGVEVGAVLLLQARSDGGLSSRARDGPEPHELAPVHAAAPHGRRRRARQGAAAAGSRRGHRLHRRRIPFHSTWRCRSTRSGRDGSAPAPARRRPGRGGRPWAAPLAWAEKKGHQRIAETLRRSGRGG